MRKIVDLKKQSKKAQKAFHATQRGSWNGINPVSRVVPSGKAYSRAKAKAEARKDACRPFFAHFRGNTKSKSCFRPRMEPLPDLFYKENAAGHQLLISLCGRSYHVSQAAMHNNMLLRHWT